MDIHTQFIISVVLNILGFVLTIIGLIVLFRGVKDDDKLQGNGLNALKYFTIQSNILYGVYAGIFAGAELAYGSADALPGVWYIIKYIATVGITLTILTVVFYLAPVVLGAYLPLFQGANLFFHLLIPIVAIVSFCFFEKCADISLPQVFLGLIPYGLYAVFYAVNALSHAEKGQVSKEYDWYQFLAKGVSKAGIAMAVMTVAVLAVCFGLWFINAV